MFIKIEFAFRKSVVDFPFNDFKDPQNLNSDKGRAQNLRSKDLKEILHSALVLRSSELLKEVISCVAGKC